MALLKGSDVPSLRVKPILPDKHYMETRISSGDRLVFRLDQGAIFFVDVVRHDDIGRFGRRPQQPR